MVQEEKNLLVKDFCGRLPYGVQVEDENGTRFKVDVGTQNLEQVIDKVGSGLYKMVLRQYESMSNEEIHEEQRCFKCMYYDDDNHDMGLAVDYLNSINIDFRGLTKNGLAIKQ